MKNFCLFLVFIYVSTVMGFSALAGTRFDSKGASCRDEVRRCISSGERTIDGFKVSKDCWEWAYSKICSYPSQNDCRNYKSCYLVKDHECLFRDSLGNCVNQKKEFSCESYQWVNKKNKTARTGFEEKDGEDSIICDGVPCLDGNCFDKSYHTNGEIMDALSKLATISEMKGNGGANVRLFVGSNRHCSKKALSYSNCCGETGKGWGKNLGASCTSGEKQLAADRGKNLCVYVGSEKAGTFNNITKRYYCCFSNLLDKVIQVQGRAQLGLNFGSGGSPNCRGLTLNEIMSLDFSQLDFSEFINDLKVKFATSLNLPTSEDLADTVRNSMDSILQYDGDPMNSENNRSGCNVNLRDGG